MKQAHQTTVLGFCERQNCGFCPKMTRIQDTFRVFFIRDMDLRGANSFQHFAHKSGLGNHHSQYTSFNMRPSLPALTLLLSNLSVSSGFCLRRSNPTVLRHDTSVLSTMTCLWSSPARFFLRLSSLQMDP